MMATTVKSGEVHCLRGFGLNRPPLTTTDGFPIADRISFLPDEPDPTINQWSYGKTLTVEVWYDDYWQNFKNGKYRRSVTWKGRTEIVQDYGWFCAIIKQWMEHKFYPLTKEQALDQWFEMSAFIPANQSW